MARKIIYTKDIILNKSIDYIKKYGISNLTVRDLCKYIGCSTQPIFNNYKNMEEFKIDLREYLYENYKEFISKYVDVNNYLLTISYAYALYAKKEPNIFMSLFITDMAGSRTIKEVLNSKQNVPTIDAMVKQYNITRNIAEDIYRDVRFYTHGIACQLCIGSIKLTDEELLELINNNIKNNLK